MNIKVRIKKKLNNFKDKVSGYLKKIKEKFLNVYYYISFEIEYALRDIRGYTIDKITCIINFMKFRKIICRDRWYDYSYLLELIKFKLRDMYYNWGKNTHYEGDYEDKEIIKKLLDDIEWMTDINNELKMDTNDYEKEYKKRSDSFFQNLNKYHRKLWD